MPAQPAHGGLRRRPDVRPQPEEGDVGVRPDLHPALRPGRSTHDDHRTATRRPSRCRRRRPGLGRVMPGPAWTWRCCGPTESPADIGEIGEIVCRGDVVMSGYWKNPEATASRLCRNGWLHTGDMGSFDERGFLMLRDRSKDVVISGGSNIYPREVEEHSSSTRASWRPGSSARRMRSGARSWWLSSGAGRACRVGRPSARPHRPFQAAQAVPVRRRVAEEQLRQGAETRTAGTLIVMWRRAWRQAPAGCPVSSAAAADPEQPKL